MTKLYHSEVHMPATLKAIAAEVLFTSLTWSKHAQAALATDRYGRIPVAFIPKYISGVEWELVEAETMLSGRPTKYVFRRPVDDKRSLVIVVCPHYMGPGTGFIKTCWVNLTTDKHKTLDRTKYANS